MALRDIVYLCVCVYVCVCVCVCVCVHALQFKLLLTTILLVGQAQLVYIKHSIPDVIHTHVAPSKRLLEVCRPQLQLACPDLLLS